MKYNAMYVEEEPSIGRIVSLLLLKERIAVTNYRTVNQAYDAIFKLKEGKKPDLLIVDDYLPDGRGYKLVPQIRRVCPDIPVIIFSGSNGRLDNSPMKLSDLESISFVEKPNIGKLIETAKSYVFAI